MADREASRARRKKYSALLDKRRATRKGHRVMKRAEAKEADEVGRDLKNQRREAAAQKRFDKKYKALENKPLFSPGLDRTPQDVKSMILRQKWDAVDANTQRYLNPGTKVREKRVYSNRKK